MLENLFCYAKAHLSSWLQRLIAVLFDEALVEAFHGLLDHGHAYHWETLAGVGATDAQ